jgi:AcrR family transcriptional regulator
MTAKTTKAAPRKKAPAKRPKPKPRKALAVGRPEYSPTLENRQKVEILIAARMAHEDIARVLGITPPTLRKHFREEILTGLAKKRAEVLVAMHTSALAGNTSAQKSMLALTGPANAPTPPKDQIVPATARGTAPAGQLPKLGKKEAQVLAAHTAGEGTDWDGLLN